MIDKITIKEIDSKFEWDELFNQCQGVNLLQTWEYGEAKKNIQGWSPERYVILINNLPVAVVQALTKKFPIIGKMTRINRGPLWLPAFNNVIKEDIVEFLHDYFILQKKSCLLIAPNILTSEQALSRLEKASFLKSNKNHWSSIILDLSLPEEELRNNLKKKWRNLLKKSEKSELELEVGDSPEQINFLLSQYERLKAEKKFSGPSSDLIRELIKVPANKLTLKVLLAKSKQKRIGGIMVLGSSRTCQYLIGWNSLEARKVNANYFLLWQALLLFKNLEFSRFDLGGINQETSPAITHFKRGLGGQEYALIGEFEAFPPGISFKIIRLLMRLIKKF